MMSVLETQFFNEDVIIVAPDSDNLSILQVSIAAAICCRKSPSFLFILRGQNTLFMMLSTKPCSSCAWWCLCDCPLAAPGTIDIITVAVAARLGCRQRLLVRT